MGQSTSSPAASRSPSFTVRHHHSTASADEDYFVNSSLEHHLDYTAEIPDECLALIFNFLTSGDRKRSSLVCRRWFAVEGQNRQRLALNASNDVVPHLPGIFARFDSVTKLSLRCDRKSVSLNDVALDLISIRCKNLTRLKLRGCREISEIGMLALAKNCKSLRKFSCGSCTFGARGMNALLDNCNSIEDLTVKRLRGVNDGFEPEPIGPGVAFESLKSITLKELYNGQCFGPLIVGSKSLKSLKILRCLGDWDRLLETVTSGRKSCCLTEIHLERLQVSDFGLMAIAKCSELDIFHLVKAPDCSNDGISAIAESCKLLRKLHIDGWRTNRIGDEGLFAIAKNSVNLVELVLIGVNPSSLSLTAISTNCQKLERLALCGSETIGDPEISCIAAKCMALKKLCIKSCRVTDSGIEAFAFGSPNLVKIKVKKCKGVTSEVANLLRARRVSLAVSLDAEDIEPEAIDASTSDGGAHEEGVEFPPIVTVEAAGGDGIVYVPGVDAPTTSNGGRSANKSRFSLFPGRTFVACAFKRLSTGNSCPNDSF